LKPAMSERFERLRRMGTAHGHDHRRQPSDRRDHCPEGGSR
jgi:hypothetical protein